ncbi:ribonuclease Z, mitochondrial-like protein [Sarcoptes scabiei]|uniref:ribonuclease Z n=1 Tax=Sarcoptes scabiei TaxID=52283 RepID=A0A132A718_SARSC|nr:ribonuclease Z, mitochondrial-like protein [Sarcoptes scabiei]
MMISTNVSSRIQLTILGNGALFQPSVIVTTEKINYLFNCGEGTQRMIIEHNKHLKLSKIENIFFTSSKYENWSGFFGFLLTVSDIKKSINFFGPSKFKNIIEIFRPFLYSAEHLELNHIINDVQATDWNKNLIDDDDFVIKSLPTDHSIAYVLLAKDKVGKICIEKCKKLKLQPGPKLALLKKGESIDHDGSIITPDQVLGPTEKGNAFIILECLTIDCLKEMFEKFNTFTQYLDDKDLELIVHITTEEVKNSSLHQKWIQQFDPNTKHLFLTDKNHYDLGLISSSKLQIILNSIDGRFFKNLEEKQRNFFADDFKRSIVENCPNMTTYNIRPVRKDSQFELLEPDCCRLESDEIKNQAFDAINHYEFPINDQKLDNGTIHDRDESPRVLFLGTGSSCPGKQRNTSAIMIRNASNRSIMLDCGESTIIQMNRYFGSKNVADVLANLELIFISHFHADHHFGLIKLIKERSKISTNPITIIAPYLIISFLNLFDQQVENLSNYYRCYPCEDFLYENADDDRKNANDFHLPSSLQLVDDLVTVNVPHCFESYGIVVSVGGEKIAYSGDSMYSDAFDFAGKDCDLLIHEATMNDNLLKEANAKRHSTISQAIEVGRNIGAKFTVLTHFSQRYAKMAPINLIKDPSLASYIEKNVIIAFDFLQISFNHLDELVALKKPLQIYFKEEIDKMQNLIKKRDLKRKIMSSI